MRNRVPAAARMAVAMLALVALAGGCTAAEGAGPLVAPTATPSESSPSPNRAEPRVLALPWYFRPRQGFEANELATLDEETFDRTGTLRLGDSVTEPVADPEGRLLALGGYNFGSVVVVDPAALEVVGKVEVERRGRREIHVIDWPASGRLLGYAQESIAHGLLPGRAFVADPERGVLVESAPLRGSVMAATPTREGAAFLVAPVTKVDRARLVLMNAQGELQTVRLRKIEAGYVDPGTPGESFLRGPALAAVRGKVYVIGADAPVAAVDVRAATVSYHPVRGLMKGRVGGATEPVSGTAGALEVRRREAVVVEGSRILVSGDETRVVRGGSHLRRFERVPQILDVERWRVRRSYEGLAEVQLAGRVLLGRDGDGRLVARGLDGEVLYRRRGRDRSWEVVGDRLLETSVNGRRVVELELRTGRVVAELGDVGSVVTSAFAWPPDPADE